MNIKLDGRSVALRKEIIFSLGSAGRGHLGPAFSCVDMVRVLFDDVMRYRPTEPKWPERDRFILSKGHGCVALYVLLADKGFIPADELQRLCAFDALLGGHPETSTPGVEACTGSLGHGLSIGVGMALSARMNRRDSRVYVLLGDGECNEGSIWEGALSASKHRLTNLTVIIDHNKSQAYGPSADVLDLTPLADKWRSFGFAAHEVDGHDCGALRTVFAAPDREKPSAIVCHTIKGKGAPTCENNMQWHHKNKIGPDEIAAVFKELDEN